MFVQAPPIRGVGRHFAPHQVLRAGDIDALNRAQINTTAVWIPALAIDIRLVCHSSTDHQNRPQNKQPQTIMISTVHFLDSLTRSMSEQTAYSHPNKNFHEFGFNLVNGGQLTIPRPQYI